MVSESQGLTYS